MTSTVRGWVGGVILGFMLALPSAGPAATLQFWPDQFRSDFTQLNNESDSPLIVQSPATLTAYPEGLPKLGWLGWVPVSLPVGTVIKSVSYYHGGGGGGSTSCGLYQVKMGESETSLGYASTNSISAVKVFLKMNPPLPVVRSDCRYFIRLDAWPRSSIRGVKLVY